MAGRAGNPFDAPYDNPFGGGAASTAPRSGGGAFSSANAGGFGGYFSSSSSAPPPRQEPPSKASGSAAAASEKSRGARILGFVRGGGGGDADADAARGQPAGSKPRREAAAASSSPDFESNRPWWASVSVPLFRCLGIRVKMHVLLPAYLAIMCANGFGQNLQQGFVNLLVLGPFLFLTVLLHEMGHAKAAQRLGGEAESILLWPLGGMVYLSGVPSARADIAVALAGPAVHVPLGIIWYFLFNAAAGDWKARPDGGVSASTPSFWTQICWTNLVMNVVMFAFNLGIPAYPLDGGRILVDLFAMCNFERDSAAGVTWALSAFLGAGILTYGVVISVMNNAFSCAVLIGMWVCWQAWGVWRAYKGGRIGDHPMFMHFDARPAKAQPAASGSSADAGGVGPIGGEGRAWGSPYRV